VADEKNTEKDKAKKPAAKKPAASKKAATKPDAAPTAKKPAAKKPAAKPKPKAETATKGKGAAEATSKTADSKAADAATSKAPAKKPAAKKPAAKKPAARPKAESKAKAKPKEPATRPVVNARARFVRVAPRKARLVADQVRGLPLEDALPLLRFSTRGAAQDIRKLLESAAANAETNHDLVADDLLIKDIHVDEGPTLRRYRPRALGRATRINKRTSHIVVALTPEEI
jgi:ribosomal protein L22